MRDTAIISKKLLIFKKIAVLCFFFYMLLDVSDSDTSSMDTHVHNANAANAGAALPPATAQADADRPAGLSDEEWQLVQMSREEKEQASPTSSATNSVMA